MPTEWNGAETASVYFPTRESRGFHAAGRDPGAPDAMIDLPTTLACMASATLVLATPATAQVAPAKGRPDAGAAAPAKSKPEGDARAAAMAALDARYVVGPATADDLGYRIVWQTEPLATRDASLQVMNATADSAWFGDSAGSIVRIRRDNGETVWRSSTYQGTDRMLSLDYLPSERHDNLYVVTELSSVALDATTGNLTGNVVVPGVTAGSGSNEGFFAIRNDGQVDYVAPVPEPGTWAAMALFAGGAAFAGWRKRRMANA
jgi:hypothetical protein